MQPKSKRKAQRDLEIQAALDRREQTMQNMMDRTKSVLESVPRVQQDSGLQGLASLFTPKKKLEDAQYEYQGATPNPTIVATPSQNAPVQSAPPPAPTKANLTGPYASTIGAMADKYGVPRALLTALVQKESQFNPRAISGAGARGLTQLMPATAKAMGVSDPFDPIQSIEGGAKYLGMQMKAFPQRPDLALAAYNAGPGNVRKYGGIPPFKETQGYVKDIMGKYMASRGYADGGLVNGVAKVGRKAQFGLAELVGMGPEVRFATDTPEQYFPANEQHNARGDAMRHLLLQAQLMQKYGETPAKVLSWLHENLSGPQGEAEKAMDEHNDELGRKIGKAAKGRPDIIEKALQAIAAGEARVLPEEQLSGGYADGGWVNPTEFRDLGDYVRSKTGMDPQAKRKAILPAYDEKEGLTAPKWLYDAVKAYYSPQAAAEGVPLEYEDAANFAATIAGGGIAGSSATPAGSLGAAGASRIKGMSDEAAQALLKKEFAESAKNAELEWAALNSLYPDVAEKMRVKLRNEVGYGSEEDIEHLMPSWFQEVKREAMHPTQPVSEPALVETNDMPQVKDSTEIQNAWDQLKQQYPELASQMRASAKEEMGTDDENVMASWYQAKKVGLKGGGSVKGLYRKYQTK